MAQWPGKSDGQVSTGSTFPQSTAGSAKRAETIGGERNITPAIASIKALNIIKRTFSIEQAA
jgi:hypothetical protein